MSKEQLQPLVDALREWAKNPPKSIAAMREEYEQFSAALHVPEGVQREDAVAADRPVAWFRPEGAGEGVIYYLHGGAYILGSMNTHTAIMSQVADAAKTPVLGMDYRLAPEHPHPAPVEDATAGYRWLLEQGHAPEQIAFMGDSAGGGLAVATMLKARDEGLPLPGAGVLFSAWTDMEGTGASMTSRAEEDPMIQHRDILQFAKLFLGDGDRRDPYAAPLHGDLRGLPPLLIQVGTAETLLDDSTRLAARAESAGVDVTLEIWEDMIHVWHRYGPALDEAVDAVNRAADFVRARLGATARA